MVQAVNRILKWLKAFQWSWYELARAVFFFIIFAVISAAGAYFLNQEVIFEKRLSASSSYDLSLPAIPLSTRKQNTQILQQIDEKHIFTAPFEETANPSGDERLKLQETLARLRLVGIVANTPPRVMIEYSDGNQTFYLSEGETFLNGIRVDKIERGFVLLDIGGQTFELYL